VTVPDWQVIVRDWLPLVANIAAVVTGVVAALIALNVGYRRHARRVRLENYLKEQRSDDTGDYGIRNIVHLMGNCSMSKDQVLEAAFASRKIKSWVATDGQGGPDLELIFQYDERARRKSKKRKPEKPLKNSN
jgi:hypothetical protein